MALQSSEQSIYLRAISLDSPAAQAAYLDEACRDNPTLRQELDALLAAHDRLGTAPAPGNSDSQMTVQRPPTECAGTVIGQYKLVETIGEGGMGTVWMAQQTEPVKRLVALKLIKSGLDSRPVIARFEAERQALALMDHPNIAKVLDGGTIGKDEGGRRKDEKEIQGRSDSSFIPHPSSFQSRPYFVMELVKGVPITKYCDEHHLTPRQRLELFVPVCQAIQHAHQKGIIHRDIKPSNVLVALYDDKPVPKIIDFGVAKATGQQLTELTLNTGFGAVVGTLEYMSPEQAGFNQLDIDTRSDIYSLGVLLYELLAGSPPFTRKDLADAGIFEMLRVIREQEPSKPSTKLNSSDALPSLSANRGTEPARLTKLVRGELDWIVMKALEKDRARRYETASGLAADLQRYLNDEQVQACPPSAGYKLRKFIRKYRAALATWATIAALLIAGIVVSGWQAVRATKAERKTAEKHDLAVNNENRALSSEAIAWRQQQEAIHAADELRNTLYDAEMNLVQLAWEADNVPRVRELLTGQIPLKGQRDLRGFEWHYWDRLVNAEVCSLQIPGPFTAPYDSPLFDRAGTRLAALVPNGDDLELQIWDTRTGIKGLSWNLPEREKRSYAFSLSPDGNRIAVICQADPKAKAAPFDLRLTNVADGTEVAAISVPGVGPEQHARLAMSGDGSRVLTMVVSVDRSRGFADPIASIQINIWNVATGKTLLCVSLGSVRRGAPALSRDGALMAAIVSLDDKGDIKSPHCVKVWDVETGKELLVLKTTGGEPLEQVVFRPDGQRIAAGGFSLGGEGVWVWDTASGKELRALGGRRVLSQVQFSPDGACLANYSPHSPTATLWDITTGQERSILKGHASGVFAVAFATDGKQLHTLAKDGTIRTWNVHSAVAPMAQGFGVASMRFSNIAVSLDGSRIADQILFGPDSRSIHILDNSGNHLRTLPLPKGHEPGTMETIVLNRTGTRVAARWIIAESKAKACGVSVWDTASGKELLIRTVSGRRLLAISPDGERLVLPVGVGPLVGAGWQRIGRILVVRVTDGAEIRSLELDPPPDFCGAWFTPDGNGLVTSAEYLSPSDDRDIQGSVRVWDLGAGSSREIGQRSRIGSPTLAVAFSSDEGLVGIGSHPSAASPGVIDVWEIATCRKRHTLRGHAGRILSIAFSQDGRRIVSAGDSGTQSELRIWDTATGKVIATWICRGVVSGLALTPDGLQLLGVRTASPDSESPLQIWDGSPRKRSNE